MQIDPYEFRKLKAEEVPQYFSLILNRIAWMDNEGIRQWNVTNYTEAYPLEYYYRQCERGTAFALTDPDTKELLCAAILLDSDKRWSDDQPALYLHNFVSRADAKGTGSLFLQYAEQYAAAMGKIFFRLDSAADNVQLSQYYENRGYMPAGECEEGAYRGILRQKKLTMAAYTNDRHDNCAAKSDSR